MATSHDREWMTVHEFAELMRVDERTVRRWIKRGTPGLDVLSLSERTTRVRMSVNASYVRNCPQLSSSLREKSGAHSDYEDSPSAD
jgi:hypothetical protein